MSQQPNTENEQVDAFLKEYAALCFKYKLCITYDCGYHSYEVSPCPDCVEAPESGSQWYYNGVKEEKE